MLAVEDVLSELAGDEANDRGLPPGFRFHPTDEELVTFYLASKVFNGGLCGFDIAEVDLNRCEPWELPEVAKMGEREWYFFSLRDRKYPTGLRTNRATAAGYWKATGKDKEIFGCGGGAPPLLGMKKTLVFYKGRAPRGVKTKWVMHEYRLDGDLSLRHTCKDEWVMCRVFNKTGDRKNVGTLNHQSYINIHNLEQSSSSSSLTLPPLLEAPRTLTTQFPLSSPSHHHHHRRQLLNLQGNDFKTLINPVVSHLNSIIFSEDHFNLAGGQKQIMKAEIGDYCGGGDNIDLGLLHDTFQSTLFQEADLSLLGLSSSSPPPPPVPVHATAGDFHVMFDSFPAGDSWPLDH